MLFPYGEIIHVIKPQPVIDEYSQEMTGWSFEDSQPVQHEHRFAVEPNTKAEAPVPGRNPIYSGLTLRGPINPGIEPHDRVVVNGEVYEVDGEVANFKNPFTGWEAGSVVNLRRGDG